MAAADDQQFCLRWNNFQANITSQFETLRDDEDFTDVTIACEGQRLQAHKVVLSACSPFFKELFKTNPCSHPIIFMRDVEAHHIVALLEFMYAGQVNVAQANLPAFLKTAESLKIRGLTETAADRQKEQNALILDAQKQSTTGTKHKIKQQPPTLSTVTASQDVAGISLSTSSSSSSSPPPKRQCKSESDVPRLQPNQDDSISVNPFALQTSSDVVNVSGKSIQPKIELADYLSDDDGRVEEAANFFSTADVTELPGGMEIIPQLANYANQKEMIQDSCNQNHLRLRSKRRSSELWLPFDLNNQSDSGHEENSESSYHYRHEGNKRNNGLIRLGEGIEIYEDQLRSVKWSDYRKLTRGLATILFSPAELATCSVTGQRWSRAGSGERPVKPALDRSKVQAIISYVATRFPMVEISRIKQVLAYKCKENSTAFKMKAVRYYEEQNPKKK